MYIKESNPQMPRKVFVGVFVEQSTTIERYCQPPPPKLETIVNFASRARTILPAAPAQFYKFTHLQFYIMYI
jgi:hypothetical protein